MVSASLFLVVVSWYSGVPVNVVVKESVWFFRQPKIISGFSYDYARIIKKWQLQNIFQFFRYDSKFVFRPRK